MNIPINSIIISFVCPVCDYEFSAYLSDILDNGNPYCPEDIEHGEALVDSDFATIED